MHHLEVRARDHRARGKGESSHDEISSSIRRLKPAVRGGRPMGRHAKPGDLPRGVGPHSFWPRPRRRPANDFPCKRTSIPCARTCRLRPSLCPTRLSSGRYVESTRAAFLSGLGLPYIDKYGDYAVHLGCGQRPRDRWFVTFEFPRRRTLRALRRALHETRRKPGEPFEDWLRRYDLIQPLRVGLWSRVHEDNRPAGDGEGYLLRHDVEPLRKIDPVFLRASI